MEGTIKKLIADKGFGFIKPANRDDDLFFHFTAVEWGVEAFNELKEDMPVTFEITKGKGGKNQATNVVAV